MGDRPSYRNYWTVISHDVIEFCVFMASECLLLLFKDATLTSDSRVSHAFKDSSLHRDEDIANNECQ
jgi:hypothetical protein